MLIALTRINSDCKVIISTHTVRQISDGGSYRRIFMIGDTGLGVCVKESIGEIMELQHKGGLNND